MAEQGWQEELREGRSKLNPPTRYTLHPTRYTLHAGKVATFHVWGFELLPCPDGLVLSEERSRGEEETQEI
eukprot:12700-Hanusia_phi.AAC.1